MFCLGGVTSCPNGTTVCPGRDREFSSPGLSRIKLNKKIEKIYTYKLIILFTIGKNCHRYRNIMLHDIKLNVIMQSNVRDIL